MSKKDKLVPLNTTIPASLKDYAEYMSSTQYDSVSDYIRTLIRNDRKKSQGNDFDCLLESIAMFIKNLNSDEEKTISSDEGLQILKDKLDTMSHLFDLGKDLRKAKIKRSNPKIREKELMKKLTAWVNEDAKRNESPGFIEISEERKRRLLDG